MNMNSKRIINVIVAITIFVLLVWGVKSVSDFFNLDLFSRFMLSNRSSPNVVWSKGLWGESRLIDDIAASRDHIYISGPIIRGGQHLNYDGYVAKLGPKTGQLAYSNRHVFEYKKGRIDDVEFTRMALDPTTKFLYLVMQSPGTDRALQKSSTDGKLIWSKKASSYKANRPSRVVEEIRIGPKGNLYIVEWLSRFKTSPRPKYSVQKRAPDGKLLWQHKLDSFRDIDFSEKGNLYVTGMVKESGHSYPAIFSFDSNGDQLRKQVFRDTAGDSDISLAIDKQKDEVNVIIRSPDSQGDVWQKYSTSGKKLNSRQLDFKVDAMVGGSSGKVYYFTKGSSKVTMHGFTWSGKQLFKEKYDRKLFNDKYEFSRSIVITADPDDDRNDAIYAFSRRYVSRLRVP